MRLAQTLLVIACSPLLLSAQEHTPAWRCIANRGQWEERVSFAASTPAGAVWLTSSGITLALDLPAPASLPDPRSMGFGAEGDGRVEQSRIVALAFEGARQAQPQPDRPALPGAHHYYVGARRAEQVPAYDRLRYAELWPGIDLVVRAGEQLCAYDLVVRPGAALDAVVFICTGGDRLEVLENGDLALHTADGVLAQTAPCAWQVDEHGERRIVPCRFELLGAQRYRFAVAEHDPQRELVIDPNLLWSSFAGGSLKDHFNGGTSHDDPSAMIAAGSTRSLDYPGGPFAIAIEEACVSKLAIAGTATTLAWSAVFGGSNIDVALDVDQGFAAPNTLICAIAGITLSPNLPVAGGVRTSFGGGSEGFVATFDSGTGTLLSSTFAGGADVDFACRVLVDPAYGITVAGITSSWNLRVQNAYDPSWNSGTDAFVWRLPFDLSSLTYGTVIGGSGDEGFLYNQWQGYPINLRVMGLDQDPASGVISLTGLTTSTNFPTLNAYRATNAGFEDVFVAVLDPSRVGAAQLLYATYVGSSLGEGGASLARAGTGRLYVGGWTYSAGFPTTAGAFSRVFTGGANRNDAFALVLDPTQGGAQQLLYSTLLGGSEWEAVIDLCVDRGGAMAVCGFCGAGFPTTIGSFQAGFAGFQDAFLARLDPGNRGVLDLGYSTLLGSSGADATCAVEFASGLRDAGDGRLVAAGITRSSAFPLAGSPFQSIYGGGSDDGWIGSLDPLPVNVLRGAGSTAHCAGPILFEVNGMPLSVFPAQSFELRFANAPAQSPGLLLAGPPLPGCVPIDGALVCVQPFVAIPLASDGSGTARLPVIVPEGLGGQIVDCQSLWLAVLACPPGPSLVSSSAFTIQL